MVLLSHFSILLFGSPMSVHRDGFIKVIVSIFLLPLLTYLFECSLPASANIQGAGGASENPPANFAMVDMCLSGNIQGATINNHTSEYPCSQASPSVVFQLAPSIIHGSGKAFFTTLLLPYPCIILKNKKRGSLGGYNFSRKFAIACLAVDDEIVVSMGRKQLTKGENSIVHSMSYN